MDVTENSVRSRFSTCLARFMVCMIIHLIRSLSDGISEYNEEVLIVISPIYESAHDYYNGPGSDDPLGML